MTPSDPNPRPAHEYSLIVHEAHLDTFGHVNNATYLQLFEQARWEWITLGGYGLETIQRNKQGPVILDCTLQFRREVTNRQSVVIRSWLEGWKGKVATVRQDMLLEESSGARTVCCSATFTMAFFDLVARRIIEPTPEWLAALEIPLP